MKRSVKKSPLFIGVMLVLALLVSGLAGCVTKTVTVSPSTSAAGTAALTVINGTQTKTLFECLLPRQQFEKMNLAEQKLVYVSFLPSSVHLI